MSDMNDAQSLRNLSNLLEQLSETTGLSREAVQEEVNNLDYVSFQFNDAILVSPSDFEGIIDSWAVNLKAELRNGAAVSKQKPAGRQKTAAKAKKTPAAKSAAKKTAKTKKASAAKTTRSATSTAQKKSTSKSQWAGSLPLPDHYRSVISHLYGPSLKRIMPADEVAQRQFLEAIANETEAGVELLNHLSGIIAEKYTGKMAPEAAYSGLQKKALALLNGGVSTGTSSRGPKKRSRSSGGKPAGKPGGSATSGKLGRKSVRSRRKAGRSSKAATVKKSVGASSANQTSVVLSEMELPQGFRKHVSDRYGRTLKNLLPQDTAMRSAYLREIVSESKLGKSFLERVADSIKLKYRGRITSDTAYRGLLSQAQAM